MSEIETNKPWFVKDTEENKKLLQQYEKASFEFYKNETTPGEGGQQREGPKPAFFEAFEGSLADALEKLMDLQNSRTPTEKHDMHYDLHLLVEGSRSKLCWVTSEKEIRVY